ncbi:hypothetical protein DFH06DRAFT_141827 [Mycena polygramma]|nr:hypothetical protein DFH06DRAFT_141827 [Mycena polygramma]
MLEPAIFFWRAARHLIIIFLTCIARRRNIAGNTAVHLCRKTHASLNVMETHVPTASPPNLTETRRGIKLLDLYHWESYSLRPPRVVIA